MFISLAAILVIAAFIVVYLLYFGPGSSVPPAQQQNTSPPTIIDNVYVTNPLDEVRTSAVDGKLVEPAVEKFPNRYPSWLLNSIDWAMELDAKNRPQTAADLRDALLEQSGRPHTFRNTVDPVN